MPSSLKEFLGEAFTDNKGHLWRTDKHGTDFLAMSYEDEDGKGHNGPVCNTCGYSFCAHCQDGPSEDCPGSSS